MVILHGEHDFPSQWTEFRSLTDFTFCQPSLQTVPNIAWHFPLNCHDRGLLVGHNRFQKNFNHNFDAFKTKAQNPGTNVTKGRLELTTNRFFWPFHKDPLQFSL